MNLSDYLVERVAKGSVDLGGIFLPAPEPRPYRQPAARPSFMAGTPEHWLVTTDLQIPFHDERLHHLSCQFAHDIRADGWVDLGDFLDLPMLSKWRMKPDWDATMNDSIAAGRQVLHDRTSAAPPWCRKVKLDGNHDARLDKFLIDKAPQLLKLRKAGLRDDPGTVVLDLDYLMSSAVEGWETVQGYPYNEYEIAPGLIGLHGNRVRKGAGASVRAELLERLTGVIMGHVNNMALASFTRGSTEKMTVLGYEVGPMCLITGSLGFGKSTADWTPGIAVVTKWPDGGWNVETIPYVNGVLRWRDQTWRL